MANLEFKDIVTNTGDMSRAKVPTGWIVKEYSDVIHDRGESWQGMRGGFDYRVALCFVYDPMHAWGAEPVKLQQKIKKRRSSYCPMPFGWGIAIICRN